MPSLTGFVYNERFLDHDTGPGHPERPERLAIGDRFITHAARILEIRMLGTDRRVIQPRRDRMRELHLSVLVLQ